MAEHVSSSLGQCRPVSDFRKLNRIGEGTYGYVYRAIDKESTAMVALKQIILHNEKNDGFPTTSIREIATLRMIDHPNCVKLLDVVVSHSREGVFLVFEYCEHDLSSLLSQVQNPFSESEIKSLAVQLLSAVRYLHEHWIIHRDIKLSNLLYNNKGEIKLADFGLARLYSYPKRSMTVKVVTLWYRAPELLLGEKVYSTAVDIWAVGCVLAELLLGRPLLAGDSDLDQLHRVFRLLGAPTDRIWPGVEQMPLVRSAEVDLTHQQAQYQYNNMRALFPNISDNGFALLNAMLTYDPSKRITGREAVRHDYFSTSPFPKEPDLMPTFPTRHDHMEGGISGEGVLAGQDSSGWAGEESDSKRHSSSSSGGKISRHRTSTNSGSKKGGDKTLQMMHSRRPVSTGRGNVAISTSSLGKRPLLSNNFK